jgi:DnaK suppressor protein
MTRSAERGPEKTGAEKVRPRAHPDSGLTEKQTETLYRTLVDQRSRLAEERQAHLDSGRFQIERVAELEEAAAQDTSQSTLIGLAENERVLLLQLDRALRKMDNGTYGVSEISGEPIGFDRLQAVPWAALSAPDQEQLEHEARDRGR